MKKLALITLLIFGGLKGHSQEENNWNHALGLNIKTPFNIGSSPGITSFNYKPSFTAFSPKGYFHRVELTSINFSRANLMPQKHMNFNLGVDYTFGKRLYERNWFSFDIGISTNYYNSFSSTLNKQDNYSNNSANLGFGIGLAPQFNIKLNNRITLVNRFNFFHGSNQSYYKSDNPLSEIPGKWTFGNGIYGEYQIGINVNLFKP